MSLLYVINLFDLFDHFSLFRETTTLNIGAQCVCMVWKNNETKSKRCAICVKYCEIVVPFETENKCFWFKFLIRAFIFLMIYACVCARILGWVQKVLKQFFGEFIFVFAMQFGQKKWFGVSMWEENDREIVQHTREHLLITRYKNRRVLKKHGKKCVSKKNQPGANKNVKNSNELRKILVSSEPRSLFKKNQSQNSVQMSLLKLVPTKSQPLELHWK